MKHQYKSAEAILSMDSEGRILSSNPAAENVLGLSRREIIGRYCYNVLHGRDPFGNRFCFPGCAILTMARQNEPVCDFDLQVSLKNGKELWLDVTTLIEAKNNASGDSQIIHILRPVKPPRDMDRLLKSLASGISDLIREVSRVLEPYLNHRNIASLARRASLTPREAEVLEHLTQGLVAKEIAGRLGISLTTARGHIQKILRKLGVHSKLEAVAMVLKQKQG